MSTDLSPSIINRIPGIEIVYISNPELQILQVIPEDVDSDCAL